MAKEKKTLYEEIVFDDVQLAVDTYNECKAKLKKVEKGFIYAIVATICNLIGWIPSLQGKDETPLMTFCIFAGFICTIIAYAKGGGIGTALGWIWKFGVWFGIWFIFPFNLFAGLLGIAVGFWLVYGAPVIIVFMNYNQIKLDFESAKKYVKYYKVKQAQEQQAQQRTAIRQSSYQSDYGRAQSTQTRNAEYQTQGHTYDRTPSYTSRNSSSYRSSGQSYGNRSQSRRDWR